MHTQIDSTRPQWASSTSYLLVTIGAVVGVGNILLFPFMIVTYGGLFVLFYLLCEIILAVPLLYTELMLGRRGKQNPVGSIGLLAYEANASPLWQKLGWLYFIIAFFTFSYYVVYVAFPTGFLVDGLGILYSHGFGGLSATLHNHLISNFFQLEPWVLLLLLSTMIVVARGIHRGIEKISCITVPSYFIILLGLAIYVCATGDFTHTLKNLFLAKTNTSIIVVFFAALAFAFLKLKVGIGSMIVYGSHLPYSVSLKSSTFLIVLFDIIISLLSYFIIFPLAQPLNPDLFVNQVAGVTAATVFTQIPYGVAVSILFFFAAIIASWTALISMLETMVATISEELNMLRSRAVWLVGFGLFLLSSFVVMCQTTLIDEIFLGHIAYPHLLREITLEKLVPIAAFFVAIFVGWVVDRNVTMTELQFKPWLYHVWRFIMRYFIPTLIIAIFVFNIFGSSLAE